MHGLYFVPALSIASLTPHFYAQCQSKATQVECILMKDGSRSNCPTPSPRKSWDSTRPSYLILIFTGETDMANVALTTRAFG